MAETAFTHPLLDRRWALRWFTPTVEVPLCGHATLATAHVLRTERAAELALRFDTASGELRASLQGDLLELDLPANPPSACDVPPDVAAALGVRPLAAATAPGDWWLLEVEAEAEVVAAAPDMAALVAVTSHGVVLTAPGDKVPVVSRMFVPAIGIDEDSAPGRRTACSPRGGRRVGEVFAARQLSARGGDVQVLLDGDRVHLGGHAVTVLRGELLA